MFKIYLKYGDNESTDIIKNLVSVETMSTHNAMMILNEFVDVLRDLENGLIDEMVIKVSKDEK